MPPTPPPPEPKPKPPDHRELLAAILAEQQKQTALLTSLVSGLTPFLNPKGASQ